MIALIQRVAHAEVTVAGLSVGRIDAGLLALIGIEKDDDARIGERLLDRVLAYRVFADADGRMNRSLAETGGGLLLVSQFTLAADTHKGLRPGFSGAAAPAAAQQLFSQLLETARQRHQPVATGQFGAHMQVSLVNDGPVTFWLQVSGGALAGP
ncbi:MAG TPA: D-aminoacyl-tRNA deacylase [Steroidobacteraceae bacterium]|nr:D-aminoacyl-tRNA deacylase [Steroidobacteraceae bacterium]HRX90148.1 D-aminoacyl-tRNA deacylase [Steroidobacteraceae bacterium]